MFRSSRTQILVAVLALAIVFFAFEAGFSAGKTSEAEIYASGAQAASSSSSTLLSALFSEGAKGSASVPAGVDLSQLWEVWRLIDQKYVSVGSTTPDTKKRVEGMVGGLVDSLNDPYSVFMPVQEAKFFDEEISGNFVGIGIEIGMSDKILTVIAPLKGTPAARAGIRSGDKILEIDGTSTYNMDIGEAMRRIRGERLTKVTLTVMHSGGTDTVKIPVIRDTIDIPTLDTEKRADGVFVIRLYSFSANAPDLFRNALREFALSGSDKLVLDLRDNPGGYLDGAVDMASWFLPTGKVIAREDFAGKEPEQVYRSKGYNVFTDKLKMAILINGGSASASEILAGALSEHGVASLIGEKSFGKGVVQELIPFDDGSSLKVTVAKWLTPNGHSLTKNGLDPAIKSELTKEDIKAAKDPQLERAASFLINGK